MKNHRIYDICFAFFKKGLLQSVGHRLLISVRLSFGVPEGHFPLQPQHVAGSGKGKRIFSGVIKTKLQREGSDDRCLYRKASEHTCTNPETL